MDSKGVYFAIIFLEFFVKTVYLTMVAKKFQIHAVKITRKYICQSKDWICLFMPPSKSVPQVFIITNPGRRKLSIYPIQSVLKMHFLSSRERADYRAEDMTKIKLSRVLVTSFDEFRHIFLVSLFFCVCAII